ncbi:MAG: TRAP transporter small permease subunit [Granulosicoccus sp.]
MNLIGILSGYACLGLSFLIVLEIVSRHFLNFSLQGVDEIGGYVVAITGTIGMALATWHRAHTRIDILLIRLPLKARAILNICAYGILTCGATFMAYMAWTTLAETIEFNSVSSSPLQTPLWIPQVMWFAGLVVFALSAAIMTFKGFKLLSTGWKASDQFLSQASLEEEVRQVPR